MSNRVVITGMGVVCPLGLDVSSMWQGLISGQSAVDYITLFDAERFDTKIAAEVKGLDPTAFVSTKEARHMDRFTQFGVAATFQAIEQASLKPNSSDMEDVGVLIGSGIGGINTLLSQADILRERGPRKVSPYLIPMMMSDSTSGQISIFVGARGPNFCTTSACSSGSDAIGEAYEIVKRGDTRAMITGGSEAAITALAVAGFNAAGALSTRECAPQEASRPFDADRDGFVMGEGAAVIVLESLSSALKRGSTPLAEIIGYGASSDAYHVVQPREGGEGGAEAMKAAMKKAGIGPESIDHINAHGTSTRLNDKCETASIKAAFGERAYQIAISSTKSMMGHLLGSAGAIEAIISILTIRHDIIPPTINLQNPDPECDLDYVPNVARHATVKTILSNSLGFGGHNSALIFREFTED